MKKLSILVAFVVAVLSLTGLCACGEDGPTFAGVVSEEIYASDEEAVQGFLENEIGTQVYYTEFFFEPGNGDYQRERELSQEEIKQLPLGTHAEGATSAERGTLSFECEYYHRKGMPAATFHNLKVSLCLLNYGEGVRYFVLPPEEGDTLTNSYFEFISYGCEESFNCCIETKNIRDITSFQGKMEITDHVFYMENSQKELNSGETKQTTYLWENGAGYYSYSVWDRYFSDGEAQRGDESKGFVENSFREKMLSFMQENSPMSLIQTNYLAPCCFRKKGNGIDLDESNGNSIDTCLEMRYSVPLNYHKFSVKMQKDHILEIRLRYELERGEEGMYFESYLKKSKFGTCKVDVPQEILQTPDNR